MSNLSNIGSELAAVVQHLPIETCDEAVKDLEERQAQVLAIAAEAPNLHLLLGEAAAKLALAGSLLAEASGAITNYMNAAGLPADEVYSQSHGTQPAITVVPPDAQPDREYFFGIDIRQSDPYELAERLAAERGFKETASIPAGSLALTTELNGKPYEDLPLTTRDELLEIARAREADFRRNNVNSARSPKSSSLEALINQTKGPLLEIGGPSQTVGGSLRVDFTSVNKPLIVANLYPQHVRSARWHSPFFGEVESTECPGSTYQFRGEEQLQDPETWCNVFRIPDAKIDATDMPDGEGYLGAIYTRAMPTDAEASLLETEAPRTLEPNGLLIIVQAKPKTMQLLAASPYFEVVKSQSLKSALQPSTARVVLRRNNTPYQFTDKPSIP